MAVALINLLDFDAITPILIHKGKRKFVLEANDYRLTGTPAQALPHDQEKYSIARPLRKGL